MQVLFPASDLQGAAGLLPPEEEEEEEQEGGWQVRYVQQSTGPYRRCAVEVRRSALVGQAERVMRLVDFFVRPVRERPPTPEQQQQAATGQEQPRCVEAEHWVTGWLAG